MANNTYTSGVPNIADRQMWCSTYLGDFMYTRRTPALKNGLPRGKYSDLVHHPSLSEPGDNIVLYIPKYIGSLRAFTALHLTLATEQELLLIKKLVNSAIDEALPIVKERDEHAKREHEDGKEFYLRVYRPVPRLIKNAGVQS